MIENRCETSAGRPGRFSVEAIDRIAGLLLSIRYELEQEAIKRRTGRGPVGVREVEAAAWELDVSQFLPEEV